MGNYFGGDNQKNVIFALLRQPELFQGNQTYIVVLSIMLNSFPSMSLSISTAESR